jgi:6-phosphofructokinase 2
MTGIVTFTPNPAVDVSTSVERVMPTHKSRYAAVRRDPGGGGINVARVVRRLGHSRLVLPLWGNGHIEVLIGAVCFA